MKNLLKNYSFALLELLLYALCHIYTGIMADVFYILFCLVMIIIVAIGIYKIYKQNQSFCFQNYKGFYILLFLCILYALQGIIRTILK